VFYRMVDEGREEKAKKPPGETGNGERTGGRGVSKRGEGQKKNGAAVTAGGTTGLLVVEAKGVSKKRKDWGERG